MKTLDKLRELAIRLRRSGASLDEIVEKTKRNRGTVYYWIRKIPLQRPTASGTVAQIRQGKRASAEAAALRAAAYGRGVSGWASFSKNPLAREFVMLYLTEGYRKSRHVVSVINSDPALVRLALHGIRLVSDKEVFIEVRIYQDHDAKAERSYWAKVLQVPITLVRTYVKNTGGMTWRTEPSTHGCVVVRVGDTQAKAYVDGLCDGMRNEINQAVA